MIRKRMYGKTWCMDEQDFINHATECDQTVKITAYYCNFSAFAGSILIGENIEIFPLFQIVIQSNKTDWDTISNYLTDLGIKPIAKATDVFYKVKTDDDLQYRFSPFIPVSKVYKILKKVDFI